MTRRDAAAHVSREHDMPPGVRSHTVTMGWRATLHVPLVGVYQNSASLPPGRQEAQTGAILVRILDSLGR